MSRSVTAFRQSPDTGFCESGPQYFGHNAGYQLPLPRMSTTQT